MNGTWKASVEELNVFARCSSQRESCNMHVKRLPSRRSLYTLRMERMLRQYPRPSNALLWQTKTIADDE